MDEDLEAELTESDVVGGFEERADQLSVSELRGETVVEDIFDQIRRELMARGLVLLEGPRGCGKTHMMRYVELICDEEASKPFPVYVSFNRYLRLEPLLSIRTDALNLFQSWALALLVRATYEKVRQLAPQVELDPGRLLNVTTEQLDLLIARLERGQQPMPEEEATAESLRVDVVISYVRQAAAACGRRRTVLLLDDAALTLSRDLLIEFFDLVRVLKTHDISPKASVYPGTTEYGPRFHADHEGRRVAAWLPVDDPRYLDVMHNIAKVRFHEAEDVPPDVNRVMMYAAFGVPRAYLTLLRDWQKRKGGNAQSALNEIVREHRDARLAEYRSLAAKLPTLATLVRTGEKLFDEAVASLVKQNRDLAEQNERQLLLGVPAADLDPMAQRMMNLLNEAGLVRQESPVSHGENRLYSRFMPHLGALIAGRAFETGKGGGSRRIVEALARPSTKHPVRRSLKNLIGDLVGQLHLDEPPCQNCSTLRLSPNQKFCHACGYKLLDESTFERCMRLPIDEVPGLSRFKLDKLREQEITTIGALVALSDPGTAIRRARGMGPQRAAQVIDTVHQYVDEFLS